MFVVVVVVVLMGTMVVVMVVPLVVMVSTKVRLRSGLPLGLNDPGEYSVVLLVECEVRLLLLEELGWRMEKWLTEMVMA